MTHEYVGNKIVTAWPQDKDGVKGYAIKYHNGHISWCPEEYFVTEYISIGNIAHMPPHEQRVIAEKVQLDTRIDALQAFTNTSIFHSLVQDEKNDMLHQLGVMKDLSQVLERRISRFERAWTKVDEGLIE